MKTNSPSTWVGFFVVLVDFLGMSAHDNCGGDNSPSTSFGPHVPSLANFIHFLRQEKYPMLQSSKCSKIDENAQQQSGGGCVEENADFIDVKWNLNGATTHSESTKNTQIGHLVEISTSFTPVTSSFSSTLSLPSLSAPSSHHPTAIGRVRRKLLVIEDLPNLRHPQVRNLFLQTLASLRHLTNPVLFSITEWKSSAGGGDGDSGEADWGVHSIFPASVLQTLQCDVVK